MGYGSSSKKREYEQPQPSVSSGSKLGPSHKGKGSFERELIEKAHTEKH